MLTKFALIPATVVALNNGGHGKSTAAANKAPTIGKCDGTQKEVVTCNQGPCDSYTCIDCSWSEWSEWGPCTCEGLQDRHRTIAEHNNECGKACSGAKVETRTCKPDCAKDAQNCALTQWSDWMACDKTCGGGQTTRSREIAQHAHDGGHTCTDDLVEVKGCNTEACEHQVDCVWGEWSEYSACSESCGGGLMVRDREIKVAPRNGGRLCDARTKTEVSPCNTQACDKDCIDGQWSAWSDWSACSASCDGGYTMRSRVVAQTPSDCGRGLNGEAQEFATCNTQSCGRDTVDCELGDWNAWGDCSCPCNGVRERSRRIATYALGQGKPCNGALRELEPCNVGNCGETPIDCVLSEWSDWGGCTAKCGGGAQVRSREIITHPSNGGKMCDAVLKETRGCNKNECEGSVDCVWGEWHDWGDCSHLCDGGEKTRYRHVEVMAKKEGKPCDPHASAEVSPCNTHACNAAVYCAWGEWTEFGECSATCGNGLKTRQRHLMVTSTPPAGAVATGFVILDAVLTPFVYAFGAFGNAMFMFALGMMASIGLVSGLGRFRNRSSGVPTDALPLVEMTNITE